MNDCCPSCGKEVIRATDGSLLEVSPHPLAIYAVDGTKLPIATIIKCAKDKIPPIGHHIHDVGKNGCIKRSSIQLALF